MRIPAFFYKKDLPSELPSDMEFPSDGVVLMIKELEAAMQGFSIDDLKNVFEEIQCKTNWKYDIDSYLDSEDKIKAAKAAISWFTGCASEHMIIYRAPDGRIRVMAAGYFTNGCEDGRVDIERQAQYIAIRQEIENKRPDWLR